MRGAEYPIQPGDLITSKHENSGWGGLQFVQIKIINDLIRKAFVPSKRMAIIWFKTLANEMGMPIGHKDVFASFFNDIKKVYNKAGWSVDIEGLTVEGYAGNAYLVFTSIQKI